MVKKESLVYLFIGQDSFSKAAKLKALKAELFPPQIENFNFDLLYGKNLNLADLQEKLLAIPVRSKKRLIVIKNAEDLKQKVKDFILEYVKKPYPQIILVLDIDSGGLERRGPTLQDYKDEFISKIARYGQTLRFKEETRPDTFTLSRHIEFKRTDYALKVLSQLLENGERPERILGGLRYSGLKGITQPFEFKKKARLLLKCDLDIKTGKLKPEFALEKLVVNLCCL